MKTLKKTLCLVLAVVMAVGVLILPASAADVVGQSQYDELANYGILKGRDTGAELDKGVRRDEVATIAYRLMTGDIKDEFTKDNAVAAANFTDNAKFGDWNRGPIGYSWSHGLFKGRGNGVFDPAAEVTGQELLAVMLRALGYGKNGEFEGKDWAYNVLSAANKYNLLTGLKDTDMSQPILRGAVAVIVLNTAKAKIVRYNAITREYYQTNLPLVSFKPATSYNKFGSPSTDYSATYNYPETTRTTSVSAGNKIYDEFWTAKPECDVADDMEKNGYVFDSVKTGDEFDTYTNGAKNKNIENHATLIEPLDTTNTIGHQGRHTIVYADRIVYIDTFLGKVTNVKGSVYDTAGHEIQAATVDIIVYSNTYAKNNVAEGKIVGVDNSSYKFADGDIVRMTLLTEANNTTSSAMSYLVDKAPRIQSIEKISPVTVTIDSMISDSKNGNKNGLVGFYGTDGVKYLYNYTFGYNTATSAADKKLTYTDITGTYNVYLDSKGNVLGIAPATTTSKGVGVVLSAEPKYISAGKYAIDYEILLPDGSKKSIRVNSKNTTWAEVEEEVSNLTKTGVKNLVSFVGNQITAADDEKTANGTVVIERGEANTLVAKAKGGTFRGKFTTLDDANVLVDDATTFFVANYTYKNSKTEYVFTDYSIYKGFKSIYDLSYVSTPGVKIDGASDPGLKVEVIMNKDKTHADYVLVLYANNQEVPDKIPVLNYAYLTNASEFAIIGDDFRLYNAIINGVAGNSLHVTNAAYVNKIENIGLYTYSNQKVNGWDKLTWYNNIKKSHSTITYAVAGGNWSIANGVLTVKNTTWNASEWTDSEGVAWNAQGAKDKYLTVADDVVFYVVNPTTGVSYRMTSSLADIQTVYGSAGRKCEIAYQFDDDGYIDLIYIKDKFKSTDGTENPTTGTAKYIVHIVDSDTKRELDVYSAEQKNLDPKEYTVSGMNIAKYVGLSLSELVVWGKENYTFTITAGETTEVEVYVYYKG